MGALYHYASVSIALEELNEMGFAIDYNIQEEIIQNNSDDYEIIHIYRYEGESDPDDSAVVYGIISNTGEKGVFVAGYAANSSSHTAKVLRDISIRNR